MYAPARTLIVGEKFPSMQELRELCKATAIFENFTYKTEHSDKKRYRIRCISSEHCPWRLSASLITTDASGNPNTVEIKTLVEGHTCMGHTGTTRHPQAGSALVSLAIQQRLQDLPKYSPIEVKHDIRREQGIHVSYTTAWRAKERAMAITGRRGSTSEPMDICFGRLQATSEERDLERSKI